MRLDLYPLEKETDETLLVRFIEECSEGIKAATKMIRFGQADQHAPPGTDNVRDLVSEMGDIVLCIAEVTRRVQKTNPQLTRTD
jgi:hypothetical protein